MLIDDIVQLLSNEKASLTDALLKTKLILHQINKKELAVWVNNELNGYPPDAELPDYRLLNSIVMGNLIAPGWTVSRQALPIQHLDLAIREKLERAEMRESLAVLQKMSTNKGQLSRRFHPEAYTQLGSNLANGWKPRLLTRPVCSITPFLGLTRSSLSEITTAKILEIM